MGNCNGCGDCCNPLMIDERRFNYILNWAQAPDPDEDPAHYEGTDFESATEEVKAQMRVHIANGAFALKHWLPNVKGLDRETGQVVISCPHYDAMQGMCTAYEDRPPICAGYPFYEHSDNPVEWVRERGIGTMSSRCSYLADVPVSFRPKGWKLMEEGDPGAKPDVETWMSVKILPNRIST